MERYRDLKSLKCIKGILSWRGEREFQIRCKEMWKEVPCLLQEWKQTKNIDWGISDTQLDISYILANLKRNLQAGGAETGKLFEGF